MRSFLFPHRIIAPAPLAKECRHTILLVLVNRLMLISSLVIVLVTQAHAQEVFATRELKKLSIEELLNIEVTSVSKGPQKLSRAASAVQVITRQDILRSGATNIPEALRLASNLQVAQLNSGAWIISARGFNTVFANKLLVLIDGRTVYTPLFAGVVWDQQNIMLDDIDRIEVISGPGGALWGANAVNGVINIITRSARETEGLYVSAIAGNFLRYQVGMRYGGHVGDRVSYRVYARHFDRENTTLPDDNANTDAWRNSQAGLRLDYKPNDNNDIIIQGDFYSGVRESAPEESPFDGQNMLARWTHRISDGSNFALQLYFDRYWRDDAVSMADELETYDIDFQHRIPLRSKHSLLWGVGYRYVVDEVQNRSFVGLLPEKKNMPLYSAFVQDEISVAENVKVTLGTKLLHHFYSGFEIQPSVRAAWDLAEHHTLWAAVSRAVRAPSRLDKDYYLPLTPQPPSVPSVAGGPDFDSEKLVAYELGYRLQPNTLSSFALALFYHDYDDVYSVEQLPGIMTYQIQNGSDAETWGAEVSGFYQVLEGWRIRGGFTYFDKDLRAKPFRNHDPSYLANDAKHMAMIQSMADLPCNFRLDIVGRYVDYIPASFATVRVPEYFTFDARLAWEYKGYTVGLTGQNLWKDRHAEFGAIEIPRSIYGKITCRL